MSFGKWVPLCQGYLSHVNVLDLHIGGCIKQGSEFGKRLGDSGLNK